MKKITDKQEAYVLDFPEAVEFANQQNEIFWLADEIAVEKDVQDILVNMTEAERHGVVTVLKLFTLYELFAGDEYWGKQVYEWFPNPSVRRMANAFSFFEINVHAPFYNKLNEALHLNTEEFYNSYVDDPVLKDRMEFIENIVDSEDKLESLGVFSMVEGAVLYSSFAFLKHFQSQSKNKLLNVVRGINFSVRDESLHAQGGAWLFNTLLKQENLSEGEIRTLHDKLTTAGKKIYEHECRIIDMIFDKGKIEGITPVQMKHFVESRINECLKNLGVSKVFDVTYNPIAEWFYDGINAYQMHDFFTGIGNQYNRNWDESAFKW